MISKTGRHAVRALVALAELPEGKYLGAAVLAELIGAPPNYLGKLLQRFVAEGLVVSQKGLGGGFRLRRAPAEITLFNILDPVEDLSPWTGCVLGKESCSETDPCKLHQRWKAVKDQYIDLLMNTNLADLS